MNQPQLPSGMELLAIYTDDDDGRAMCLRSKKDGIRRGVRMWVNIPPDGHHKNMLCLYRDKTGIKRIKPEDT